MIIRRIFAAALALTLLLVCGAFTAAAEADFSIHFLGVSQGEAAVVMCDGEIMLIDSGGSEDSGFIYSYLTNTLNVEHIDHVVATYPHDHHIGGLSAALNACSVGSIYSPVSDYSTVGFVDLCKYADQQGVAITVPGEYESFDLGAAEVQLIHIDADTDDIADSALIVRIVYGSTSFLFTSDMGWAGEQALAESGYDISATLLKAGNHGSDNATTHLFLESVAPEYGVICVPASSEGSLPDASVVQRLEENGAAVYSTGESGTIIVTSDGYSLSFSVEHGVSRDGGTAGLSGEGAPYIGNKNSKKFHHAQCPSVDNMKDSNKVEIYSREDAINEGYVPCKNCDP